MPSIVFSCEYKAWKIFGHPFNGLPYKANRRCSVALKVDLGNKGPKMSVRLTIVQYGGDYRETYNRFAKGGKETYYAQRYSVNLVGSLAQRLDQVAVICGVSEERYDTLLENGVRAIGAVFNRVSTLPT